MLRTESVANLVESKLNLLGQKFEPKYQFKLFAEIGENKPSEDIKGIIIAKKGSPIKNKYYVDVEYTYFCKLMVPCGLSNVEVINVKAIIDDFIRESNGDEYEIDNGKGIFTFETSETEQFKTEGGFGNCVPVGFSFRIKYTENFDRQAKYYLGLCDTQFDNSSSNTRYFEATETKSAKEVQIEYWEDRVKNGCVYEEITAPNLDSIDIVSQVYRNTHGYEIYELTNKNYAVVKVERDGKPIKYYYYFVTNTRLGTLNRVIFDLKLDTIQTFFFEDNITFSDCLITRAHLNRWKDNNDGTVSFDGGVDSKLFEREDFRNVAKRLTKRTRLNLYSCISNAEAQQWLQENVLCWVYFFCDPLHRYLKYNDNHQDMGIGNIKETSLNPKRSHDYNAESDLTRGRIPTNFSVMCFPILRTELEFDLQMKLYNTDYYFSFKYGMINFRDFVHENDGYNNIYAVKISKMHPFSKFSSNDIEYSIKDNVLTMNETSKDGFLNTFGFELWDLQQASIAVKHGGFINIVTQASEVESLFYDIPYFRFHKTEIVNAKKDSRFNPKLLNADYRTLKLVDETGQGFDYDIQKLNLEKIIVKISSPHVVDVSRTYGRIGNLSDDGIYIKETDDNFTGFVSIDDNSLVMLTTAYQSMLANNKNFFLQNTINRISNFSEGIATSGLNALRGDNFSAISGAVATVGSVISSKISENLAIDNIKNAPADVQNAKGNALFSAVATEFGVFIEEYDILESEKEVINDYMDLNGFSYNQIDNIKNVCNIRRYHNYVQADIDSISGISISNNTRDDLRQRFHNGVRFWNSDNIQYELENYENWLEGN